MKNKKVDRKKLEKTARRLNGVLIAMDPRTGDIRAVVGGVAVSENGSMANRVWSMRRQPGSAVKGFLYAAALDEGVIDYDSEVVDEEIQIDGYSPRNWYKGYKGGMSLRSAVALSVNTVAVKTLDLLGVERFRDRLGTALEIDYLRAQERFSGSLSLALGSGELTPMELTRLYALILNGGVAVQPRLILKIENETGETIWENYGRADDGVIVLSEDACIRALHLLRGVFDPELEGTASWIGRLKLAKPESLPFDIAGKSGTVQVVRSVAKKFPGMRGVHDAWFVGLVPDEVTAVWVGHDEGAPFPGGGAGTAGAIWRDYALFALPGETAASFPELPPPEEEESPEEDALPEILPNVEVVPERGEPVGERKEPPEEVEAIVPVGN